MSETIYEKVHDILEIECDNCHMKLGHHNLVDSSCPVTYTTMNLEKKIVPGSFSKNSSFKGTKNIGSIVIIL